MQTISASSLVLSFVLAFSAGAFAETFVNPTHIAVSGTPVWAAAGDLNGDGKPDLLYGTQDNFGGFTVGTLLAQPSGPYKPASSLSLPAHVAGYTCQLLDTNRDTHLDLVCPLSNEYTGALAIFAGNGDGTFRAPAYVSLPPSNGNYAGIELSTPADLNGDGMLDLVATDLNNSRSYIMLGDGTGGFALSSTLATAGSFQALDLNNDGKPDLLFSSGAIAKNLGGGAFQFQGLFTSQSIGNCFYADLDKDGYIDAACLVGETPNFAIFRGNGTGGFASSPTVQMTLDRNMFLWVAAIRDVNGDGLEDILISGAEGLGVILANGSLSFDHPTSTLSAPRLGFQQVTLFPIR